MSHRQNLNRMCRSIVALPKSNSIQKRSIFVQTRTRSCAVRTSSRSQNHSFNFGPPVSLKSVTSFPTTRDFSSPTFTKPGTRKRRKFVPRKAAVELTEQARTFFKALLESNPQRDGIILNYQQASSGQPRMVFSFGFVTRDQLTEEDEGVSLELLEDGTPKSPKDSLDDGLPKLYIHHNAFLKVLGAKLDVNTETISPILYDREGNTMDPNA